MAFIASIDFGTTFSGWAYSTKSELETNPLAIKAKNWPSSDRISEKAPTCVLIKPDGKTFHSFGYEAQTKYTQLAQDESHEEWYYFRRFKMLLFDKLTMSRNEMLEDETGKRLSAQTVFSLSIQFLHDDLLKTLRSGVLGIKKEDIDWVLTVPAIWNDAAKQFMRESAIKAGIEDKRLSIALEPECASLFCRKLPVDRAGSDSLASVKAGTEYIVLDAGGGTVDISVHEVLYDGNLRELHKASGGAWGGTKVDKAYIRFLDEITEPGFMNRLREESMEDYIDMIENFERKKRETDPKNRPKFVVFRAPSEFVNLAQRTLGKPLSESIAKTKYGDNVKHTGDKLKVAFDVAASFFDEAVNSVVGHMKKLLADQHVKKSKIILMVGGFSESAILQDAIKHNFPSMKTIIPGEAGLAVLKGAVLFGHNPSTITERKCKYTYGEVYTHKYKDTCTHRVGKRNIDENGDMRCYNLFEIHARSGQSVKLYEEQEEKVMTPRYDNQTVLHKRIYVSQDICPELTTDPGCKQIGQFVIPIPDTSLGRKRKFVTTFMFGGTEIEVKVVDKASGQTYKKRIDFLE